MKKIGIVFGNELSFPKELVERINSKTDKFKAESLSIDAIKNTETTDYSVIFDRISYRVPFYNSFLKLALLNGTRIVNNPFWNCADNNIFQSALAAKIGIPTPKTVLLPSKELPDDTNADTFHNLKYPLNWDEVFSFVKFPAYLKPNFGHTSANAYKVYNRKEFFSAYELTGKNPMVVQESINFDAYYRCFVIASKRILIVKYEPGKPLHMRYEKNSENIEESVVKLLTKICNDVSNLLGFEFNSIDIGLLNGTAYAIDLVNPTPHADKEYLGESHFEWLIENTADYLIEIASSHKEAKKDFTFKELIFGESDNSIAAKPARKARATKAVAPKPETGDAPKKRGRPRKES
ncbi:MAG: hypothetical protein M9949_14080 [Candidatus Kapabacteria bacterium]|nr:hypothetical protein [Candidatus Kapabacteria bacterium]